MKKILTLSGLLLLSMSLCTAQFITEKTVTSKGSYGENKLKKAPKKVFISNFQVYFHVVASATASSQGGRQMGGGSVKSDTKTSMTVAVNGVDVEDFKAVTNKVYQDFIAKLTAAGFEIIPTEKGASLPVYEGWSLKDGGNVNYANIPGYVAVVPEGQKYFVKKVTDKGREKGAFLDKSPKISKGLDNAIVLDVAFAFPFIKMDANSSNMLGTSSVKAKTDFVLGSAVGNDGMALLVENTLVKFVYGNPAGAAADAWYQIAPTGEIPLPGVFAEEKFKERTVSSSTPAYYNIVFVDTDASNVTHQANCDPAKYQEMTTKVMTEYLDTALKGLLENMK